jgi:H+-translocating NAD(P) transhydrogenase subunit beta
MSNITAISYLISSVLFILALRGLSSPTTSRQGNVYGMIGMLLAVITTFLIPTFKPVYWLLALPLLLARSSARLLLNACK